MASSTPASFTSGTTTITAEIPAATLTAAGNVDLYKLATYTLSGLSALASRINEHEMRMTTGGLVGTTNQLATDALPLVREIDSEVR